MSLRRPSALLFSLLTIASFLVGATSVQAQLLGPVQHLPDLQAPGAGLPPVLSTPPFRSMDDLLRGSLSLTRKLQIDVLRRSESRRVDVDPQGAPILRGEFLATGLSGAPLDAVRALGFSVDRATPADATLGLDFVVLHDTHARSTARAMRALRRAAPDAEFTYQHLYLPAGADDVAAAATPAAPSSSAPPQRVGLIDGGVDPSDPALVRARIERHGCSAANPSRHGTAVAARLVAGDPDTLYAADLWCGDAVGGTTSNLVDALAWMAREHVAVINISLVGPDNPVLAQAVRAMIARGHVLVSAVGNDGPAAPPLFPAAYPDVIGVSGVDAHDRVLPESGSGDQVDFCASGVLGSGRNALRGTSFAAPIVARKAAQWLDAPRAGAAADVQRYLAGEAHDLGPAGRDPRYGNGLLSP